MQRLRAHAVDAQGGVLYDQLDDRYFSRGAGPPVNGVQGYNPASLWLDEVNKLLYQNVGDQNSSNWVVQLAGVMNPIVVPPATTTLTLAPTPNANRVTSVAPTGGLAITMPTATGSGLNYTILLSATVAGGNLTIDAKPNGPALFSGYAQQNKPGTGLTATATAANTNLITLNGSTQGGIAGDQIELQDTAPNVWTIFINGQYSGVFASPFSNH
jgi:hypothetical protein